MAKKKKRPVSGRNRMRSPISGYDWMFAPLYGPWAAISTAYPAQQDPSNHPAYPGEGGINSGDVPAGTNSGMGPMESTMKPLKALTEGLAHMSNVLGAGMSDEAITSMFFDEMPLADPGSEAPVSFDVPADVVGFEEPATAKVAPALTAVMHKAFSKAADDMMIAGYLSQEQRIAISGCVSAALEAFTLTVETDCPWALDQAIDDGLADRFMESAGPMSGQKAKRDPVPGVKKALKLMKDAQAVLRDEYANANQGQASHHTNVTGVPFGSVVLSALSRLNDALEGSDYTPSLEDALKQVAKDPNALVKK